MSLRHPVAYMDLGCLHRSRKHFPRIFQAHLPETGWFYFVSARQRRRQIRAPPRAP